MRGRQGMVLGLVVAAAILLVGCAPPTQQQDEGASGGAQTVRVSIPHQGLITTSLPLAVANARGFFQQHGVAVEPVHASGGGNTVQTVIGQNSDMAVETGTSAVMSAYQNGAKLKIVAATMTGLDVLFFVKASSPFQSIADLSGQKVGYSQPGSSSNVAVDQLNANLQNMGLPPAIPEAIGGPPDQLTAVQTGQIAAGFTAAPLFLDQVAAGQLRIVAQPKDFSAYRDVVVRVAFTRADFAQQHPEAVRGFLAAWQQAWDWSFQHKAEAVQIYKQALGLKEDVASLQEAFEYLTPEMVRLAPIKGLDRAAADALRFQLIKAPLNQQQLTGLVDTSFVPAGQ